MKQPHAITEPLKSFSRPLDLSWRHSIENVNVSLRAGKSHCPFIHPCRFLSRRGVEAAKRSGKPGLLFSGLPMERETGQNHEGGKPEKTPLCLTPNVDKARPGGAARTGSSASSFYFITDITPPLGGAAPPTWEILSTLSARPSVSGAAAPARGVPFRNGEAGGAFRHAAGIGRHSWAFFWGCFLPRRSG